LIRNNPSQCSAHEGPALTGPDKLFAWYRKHELQKIKIQVWIAFLINWLLRKTDASELSSQNIQGCEVRRETGKRSRQCHSPFITLQRLSVSANETRVQPYGRSLVFLDGPQSVGQELAHNLEKQIKPGFSFVQRPEPSFMRETPELAHRQ